MKDKLKKTRLTRAEKNSGDKAWYKEKIDYYDGISTHFMNSGGGIGFSNFEGGMLIANGKVPHARRMKINYDLFNSIIDKSDFNYIIRPFGEEFGELPANFSNKDIVSGKVKALLGLEMKRPFEWRVAAVNDEATTRKEQEFTEGVKSWLTQVIMGPIEAQLQQQAQEQTQGQPLTGDQQAQMQAQLEEQKQAMTPKEYKKYMTREHQDPAEVQANQLLQYVLQKEDFMNKMNKLFKHGLLSAIEVCWVGIVNGEPVLRVINPLKFSYDKSPDLDFIEDGEWANYQLDMTPSEIVSTFNEELEDKDIDDIYASYREHGVADTNFTFTSNGQSTGFTIPVIHVEFKDLKAVKFLTRQDIETGEEITELVDESYTLNKEAGDLFLETKWIPYLYEGYKIKASTPKYVYLREVPGQYKNLDNLYECKLSYVGGIYDDLNSEPVSVMDRMKQYQYMYNATQYRVELLMNSDEGKKLFLNLNAIPKTQGIDMAKFMYYLKASNLGYLDPSEEGKRMGADITNAVKEVDLSLISDIQKYIELSEFIKKSCGRAVGIPEEMEGQISADQSVSNTNNTIVQSSNVIEPLFALHNTIKRNILRALLRTTKVAYSTFPKKKLSYILDDMSLHMLDLDESLLDESEFGLFVTNSSKSAQALDTVRQLSHAAMQNQTAELSDIIKIYKANTLQEAEELLAVAEQTRIEREQSMQKAQMEAEQQAAELQRDFERESHEREKELINLEFDRKEDLEITKQVILAMGFNENKDMDNDGQLDVLEVGKFRLDAEIKMRKQALDESKQANQEKKDAKQAEQTDEKLRIDRQKLAAKPKTI